MVKKGVLVLALGLLLFIALSFCCSAALVFNKYILPNDTAKVQGNTFTFSLSEDWEKLYFRGNGTSGILQIQNCKDTTFYTVCYNGTRYNLSNGWGTVDKWNREIPLMLIKITDRAPSIKMTRTIDNASLLLGEETTIRVQIKNDGNADLYSVVYTDDLPKQLLIEDFPHMTRDGSRLTWEGGIDAGKNRSLYYDVKALAPFDVQTKAKLTYEYGNKSKQLETTALKIKVIEPLNMTYRFTKNNMSIYENTTFNISFKNTDTVYPINITVLRIYIPENLLVRSYSSELTKLYDGSYRWQKNLAKNTKTNLEMNLSSTYYGTYLVKADLDYTTHNTKFTKKISGNLTFYINKIKPIFWLKSTSVRAGEENKIEIGLHNSNKKVSFKDIRCGFEGSLIGNTARSYDIIGTDSELDIFSLNFTPPYSETSKNYSVTVSCNYKSLNGQQFFTSGTYNITAKPGIGLPINKNETAIQFGNFLNESNGTGVTRETIAGESTTTSRIRPTTTLPEEEQQPQATGVTGFFAKIGHFVRSFFS